MNDEKATEIYDFLTKNQLEYDHSLIMKDDAVYLLKSKEHGPSNYKIKKGSSASPLQFRIYDNEGQLVSGWSQCYGPFKKLNILKTNPPNRIAHLPNNYDLILESKFDLIELDNKTRQIIIKESKTMDYTFIVYWNIWGFPFVKDMFKEIEKYRNQNPELQILLVLINTAKDE